MTYATYNMKNILLVIIKIIITTMTMDFLPQLKIYSKLTMRAVSKLCYMRTQITFNCSKSTIETLEKGVKYKSTIKSKQ